MRRDMPKVLVERPRGGRRKKFRPRRLRFERRSRSRDGEHALPERMPIAHGRTKWLNENLAPLRRFLVARRGRPWDEVYSELRARLAPRNTVDMHVLQHLFEDVWFEARDRAGRRVLRDRFGREAYPDRPDDPVLAWRRYRGYFYVCLAAGRLRWVPPERRPRRPRRDGRPDAARGAE